MRIINVKLLVVGLIFLSGCDHKPKPQPPAPKAEKSGYIRRANNPTVVVFVHGIFGGPESTWTNTATNAYWPELLSHDPAFANADIFTLGYDSPFFSSSFLFDDLIESTRLKLDYAEVFSKHERVVFVCHSMGGLIIRGLLSRYEDLRKKVPLIYFLSTPTAGSHIANIAKLVSRNPQVKILGPIPNNSDSILRSQQSDWRALKNRPSSKCAYETRDTDGIRVVDQTSASSLCDGPLDPIDSDHIGIAKPENNQADSYISFLQTFVHMPPQQLNADTAMVEGHIDTLRKVEVDCGEVKQDPDVEIAPPIQLVSGQVLTQTLAALQEASNLKSAEVSNLGRKGQKAALSYNMVGLDRSKDTQCASKGIGVILIAFFLSQPQSMPLPNGFQVTTSSDQTIAMLSRPGAVRIENVANVDPIEARSSNNRWVLLNKFSTDLGHYTAAVAVKRVGDCPLSSPTCGS